MKTFTKILTAAAATALLATGCVNEDPAYKNNEPGTPPDPNAKGYLTLADMSMRVVVDTDTETRPDDTSDETAKPQTRTDEAQPDVDTFIIEIRDATGKLALQETYGDLKASIGEAGRLELPVGGYTMEVRSEDAGSRMGTPRLFRFAGVRHREEPNHAHQRGRLHAEQHQGDADVFERPRRPAHRRHQVDRHAGRNDDALPEG